MAIPAICSDCDFYDPIDETTGKCKKAHVQRHAKPTDGCITEIDSGWPIATGSEKGCGEGEETA